MCTEPRPPRGVPGRAGACRQRAVGAGARAIHQISSVSARRAPEAQEREPAAVLGARGGHEAQTVSMPCARGLRACAGQAL